MTFTRDTVDNDGAQCSFGPFFKGARQRNSRSRLRVTLLSLSLSLSLITGIGSPELVYVPRFDDRL